MYEDVVQYPMQFKVESASIADSFAIVIASPQSTRLTAAVDADQTISTA